MKDGFHVKVVENLSGLGRVEHITGLVDAELVEDDSQFLFQHLAHTVLHRAVKDEVDSSHNVILTDTIHTTDTLFKPHRVPGDVVVDYHMAELKVQAFAACICRNQNARVLCERFLDTFTFIHVHGAVQADYREASITQELFEHPLGGHKFREHEYLEVRVAFFLLQTVNPVQ